MEKERGEIEIGVCVCWSYGEHVRTENTCRRDTSDASGRQWANAGREVATPFSFSLFIWELCVSVVEALSGNLVLFKCSDCHVIRVFLFPCSIIIVPVHSLFFYMCVIKLARLMFPFHRVSFLY